MLDCLHTSLDSRLRGNDMNNYANLWNQTLARSGVRLLEVRYSLQISYLPHGQAYYNVHGRRMMPVLKACTPNWIEKLKLSNAEIKWLYGAGGWSFGRQDRHVISENLIGLLQNDFWGSITKLWDLTLYAISIWLIVTPLLILLLDSILKPLIGSIDAIRAQRNHFG